MENKSSPDSSWHPHAAWWSVALLVLLSAIPFLPAITGGLVYDDILLIGRNPHIQSLENLPKILSSGYWDFLSPDEASRIGYWRPLTTLLLSLANLFGGGSTLAFHLFNLLAHLGCTALVFRLLRRLTKRQGIAFWGALIFGLHPAHVESVAWISGLNDPISGIFIILSLDHFLAWRRLGSKGFPWRAALWLLPGLLAKEMAVTAIPLALVLDLAPGLARSGWKKCHAGLQPFLRAYLPYGLIILIYYLARVGVYGNLGAGFAGGFSLGLPILNMFGGFLAILAWPFSLQVFRSPVEGLAIFPLCVCVIYALALIWAGTKRREGLLLGLLFIPAGLLPILVSTAVLGAFPLADRYLYIPVMGFAILTVSLFSSIGSGKKTSLALALICLLFGARSLMRAHIWQDQRAFLVAAVEESPDCPYPHWGLAKYCLEEFQAGLNPTGLQEAKELFTTSLNLVKRAHGGDRSIYASQEDFVQSRLGLAWCQLASLPPVGLAATGKASRLFRPLTTEFPNQPHAWTGLGVAYGMEGRNRHAEEAFRKALALEPNNPDTCQNLAFLLARMKSWEKAYIAATRALALNPNSFKLHYLAGKICLERSDRDRTRHHLERALALLPSHRATAVVREKQGAFIKNVLNRLSGKD